ncbi:helix-turn-helix domain-containing protein [Robinsoniella sp. KNHs210]|uniref:helix-turn-helix domain-containing protein n=1 Tax=Robinsoniella sp. KNHs210 TaxID=1469950 RepID=UPI0009DF68B5|nr:helix-turn-helix domain-containing protein [Robinsoniella sp. KNHs210]
MFNDFPDVVDVTTLCKMLKIEKKSAYNLLHKKQIPYKKIGRLYKIRKDAVIEFMNST